MSGVPFSDCAHHYAPDLSVSGQLAVRCTKCGERIAATEPEAPIESVGDARAQLWARVYAAVLGSVVNTVVAEATGVTADHARRVAVGVANYAVRDFDEHYLGGKR